MYWWFKGLRDKEKDALRVKDRPSSNEEEVKDGEEVYVRNKAR